MNDIQERQADIDEARAVLRSLRTLRAAGYNAVASCEECEYCGDRLYRIRRVVVVDGVAI